MRIIAIPEEGAHLVGEQRRLFQRREMSPWAVAPIFRKFAKISDIGAMGPGFTGRLIGKARTGKATT